MTVNSGIRYADIVSLSDYYPFGMVMPGRNFTSDKDRFGFNGKELDDEDGFLDYGNRMYDPRIGRWFATDPYAGSYVPISPYSYGLNSPVYFRDSDGNIIVNPDGTPVTIVFDNTGFPILIEGDEFTARIISAMARTSYGREALKAVVESEYSFSFKSDPEMETHGHTTDAGGNSDYVVRINESQTAKKDSRFTELLKTPNGDEGYLNVVVIHELIHKLNSVCEQMDLKEENWNDRLIFQESINLNAEKYAIEIWMKEVERHAIPESSVPVTDYVERMDRFLKSKGILTTVRQIYKIKPTIKGSVHEARYAIKLASEIGEKVIKGIRTIAKDIAKIFKIEKEVANYIK
jgi:RHS repeat-associated protein